MFLSAYLTGQTDFKIGTRFTTGDNLTTDYQRLLHWPIGQVDPDVLFQIRAAVLLDVIAYHHGADVIMKTHNVNAFADDVRLIPPAFTRGALYVVRDPRDVACSWFHHGNCKDHDEAVDFVCRSDGQIGDGPVHVTLTWSDHVRSWICQDPPAFDTTVIRYEDLLTDATAKFRILLEGMGRPIDDDRFRLAIESTRFGKLQDQERKKGFAEKRGGELFFRKGQSGQWRDVLSKDQVARIEEVNGDMMDLCKYERARS